MTLSDAIADLPRLAREVDQAELPRLRAALAEADSIALLRLVTPPMNTGELAESDAARSLSASEAARRLGVSPDYLYKQAKARRLPFAVRIGRRVVFDARGLDRWRRQRAVKMA